MLQMPNPNKPQSPVRIKVTRPFMIPGKSGEPERVEVDSVITVQPGLAAELIGSNKAEITDERERSPRSAKEAKLAGDDKSTGAGEQKPS